MKNQNVGKMIIRRELFFIRLDLFNIRFDAMCFLEPLYLTRFKSSANRGWEEKMFVSEKQNNPPGGGLF